MKNRGISNSASLKQIKKKKRNIFRNKLLVVFLGLFIIFAGLSYFSQIKKINIRQVEVVGNEVLDSEPIEKIIKENISGKYIWLFPKSNFLIYPKKKLETELTSNFSRIKDLSFNIKDSGTLVVSFSEREPEYIWCGENLPESEAYSEDSKCYFMDKVGYIFDEAPFFSGEVYFRFFGKIDNVNSPAGSNFMPDNFENLISFKENVSTSGPKPQAIYIRTDGNIEVILSSSLPIKNAPKIVFKKDSDIFKIAENLQSALAVDPLKTKFKENYKALEYIDLRFGNKVYYKFND